jgi:hypothetical protein
VQAFKPYFLNFQYFMKMKNNVFRFLFLGLALAILGLSLQSFTPVKSAEFIGGSAAEWHAPMSLEMLAVGGYVRANYRLDTLANTNADTIGIYSRTSTTLANVAAGKYYLNAQYTPFLSLYTADITIEKKNLTGTTTVALYLEKSATTVPTTTGWVLVDSTSTAAAGVTQIRITDLTGEIYRLRVKGRGTQSSTYKIDCLFKKKN